jgi:hypothetical protein
MNACDNMELQDVCQRRAAVARLVRTAAWSHVHDACGGASGSAAIYTLADPRDVRCPRYVGQTRDPRRRFAQHVRAARLWLPDALPWWVRAPRQRPLYEWLRALHRDGGRLPFLLVEEWIDVGGDPLAAERAAIIDLCSRGAPLLNVEAERLRTQRPLL